MDLFCKDGNIKYLSGLTTIEEIILINYSFKVLVENKGNLDRARSILVYYGQIQEVYTNDGLSFYVYKGSSLSNPAIELERTGITTIPVIEVSDLPDIRKEFISTLEGFPEYTRGESPYLNGVDEPLVYVLGGFAALGNPASFHNELVRKLRMKAYKEVTNNLFKPLIEGQLYKKDRDNMKIEVLFDRMMYRMKSMKPSAESWHRDVMPSSYIEEDDEVYGGWINLDSVDQYVSCIPGSHLGIRMKNLKEGFAKVHADDVHNVNAYKQRIRVPPGHCVIFPQYILHEVVANAAKYDMFRLFTGWRKTLSDKYLRPGIVKDMEEQAVMRIPGGMIPPMYAANHGSFFLRKEFKPIPNKQEKVNLISWSGNTMKPETIVEKGDPSYKIVSRFMKSLEHYGFPKYPPYTEEEKAIYKPRRIDNVKEQFITYIRGDLLNSKEQYIAHQCNCIGTKGYGLSSKIFKKFPGSNVYSNRTSPDIPGTIKVKGRIINMFAQYSVGKPTKKETTTMRQKWFSDCLDKIALISGITSIAFPWMIGSGLAGGDWTVYSKMLDEFAIRNSTIRVVVYRLL
jgi:hypothetical protein